MEKNFSVVICCLTMLFFTQIAFASDHTHFEHAHNSSHKGHDHEDHADDISHKGHDHALNPKQTFIKASSHEASASRKFSLEQKLLLEHVNQTDARGRSGGTIELPDADGKLIQFEVQERSNFAPGLAKKYPNIKSYRGYSVDQPWVKLHMSTSTSGIAAAFTDARSKVTTTIERVSKTSNQYLAYTNLDAVAENPGFSCSTPEPAVERSQSVNSLESIISLSGAMSPLVKFSDESTLTTYRLAVATNGQYTDYHGGTVEGALSAINETLTVLNVIFETDIGIRLELIENNDLVIYTDAATDPFQDDPSNLNGTMNAELQQTLDSVIGTENYDVGHVYSGIGGGGNAGAIGAFCDDGVKGSAWSAAGEPEGYYFINLIAHEMGHQLGANHTFSMRSEGTGVNMEPGSGTTIMSYAGVAGVDNVAFLGDNYYHNASILQGLAYLKSQSCQVTTEIDNKIPSTTSLGEYTIPVGTPFILEGAATDEDSEDVLTYTWEQKDDGVVTADIFGPENTQGANFRSLPPSTSPVRYFPNLDSVLAGELTQTNPDTDSTWETLSTVPREYNFSFTVRDNALGGGGVASADTKITVIDNGGAFEVTSQNLDNTYIADTPRMVTWNVAGTNQSPIAAPNVDIELSDNGGQTFDYMLAQNAPNSGSYEVVMPDIVTSTARIRVSPVGNIFYAVNTRDFSITRDDIVLTVDQLDFSLCQNDSLSTNFIYETATRFTDTAVFSSLDAPEGMSVDFDPTSATATDTTVDVRFSASADVVPDTYSVKVLAQSDIRSQQLSYTIKIYSADFDPVGLTFPEDAQVLERLVASLTWEAQENADEYIVEIASDAGFTDILITETVVGTSIEVSGLDKNSDYFWRVTPVNFCGSGAASTAYRFTTPNQQAADDVPVSIDSNSAVEVFSTLTIEENLRITDLNVLLDIPHTYVSDLTITLTSPAGLSIDLFQNSCGSSDDIDAVFDDEGSPLQCGFSSPVVAGSVIPQGGRLSFFDEQSTQGDWVLKIFDYYAEDGGSIDYFAFDYETDGEWENAPPIAFSQSLVTSEQSLEVAVEGLDPERQTLSFELVDPPSEGQLLGNEEAVITGSAQSNDSAIDVKISTDGNTAYVADSDAGLTIYDVSDSSNPVLIGSLALSQGSAEGLAISPSGNQVLMATSSGGLQLVDVSNSAAPSMLGSLDGSGLAKDVVASADGMVAYVAASTGKLWVVDITDSGNPTLITTVTDNLAITSAVTISSAGDRLYVADQISGLVVFDISDSTNPVYLAGVSLGGQPEDVYLSNSGDTLYVASGQNGVAVVDLSDGFSPSLVAILDTEGAAKGVSTTTDDGVALVADSGGLVLYDVGDVSTPVYQSQINTTGSASGVATATSSAGEFSLLVDGDEGINVVTFEKKVLISGDSIPETLIFQSPDDTTASDAYVGDFSFRASDGELYSNVAVVEVMFSSEAKDNGVYTYLDDGNGSAVITGCVDQCPSNLDLPESIGNLSVSAISGAAFADGDAVALTIPDSVTEIGDSAFVRNAITELTIGSAVTRIGVNAFAYNQLSMMSFLGDRPAFDDSAFVNNRELDFISYCADKEGWPGAPVSTGTNSVVPSVGCDAVNISNQALDKVKQAVLTNNVSNLLIDDLTAVIGLENIQAENFELYKGMIKLSLVLVGDDLRVSDLQSLVDQANAELSQCAASVYIVKVSPGLYPNEVSWSLQTINGEVKYTGGAPSSQLMCLDDARYELVMNDSEGDGWNFADFVISDAGGDKLYKHSLLSFSSDTVAVNLGDYPNIAPVANDVADISNRQGQTTNIELSGSDADGDELTFYLNSPPNSGTLRSFPSGSGLVGELFLESEDSVRGIAVSSDQQHVYVADYTEGLKILDISNPENPIQVGESLIDNGVVYGLTLSNDGSVVYLFSAEYGILVYDVNIPSEPVLLTTLFRTGTAYPLSGVISNDGNTLYVAAYEYLMIVDITNPAASSQEQLISINTFAWDIALAEQAQRVYLAAGERVISYSIDDPNNAVFDADIFAGGTARGLRLSPDENSLFVANGNSGMQIVDLSDLSEPKLGGNISTAAFSFGIAMAKDGKTVYVTSFGGDLQVVDVSDAYTPEVLWTSNATQDSWRAVASDSGDRVYVADGYTGFKVIKTGLSEVAVGDPIDSMVSFLSSNESVDSASFTFSVNDGRDASNEALVSITIIDDFDGDGIEDSLDNCPEQANSDQNDFDQDGVGDVCDTDDDNDGVLDVDDAFPFDSSEDTDSDGDGVGDNSDWAPNDPSESADSDGDGVGDNADQLPNDATETVDTDGDGIGNNADNDDDNDGVVDEEDAFPLDDRYSADSDSDGMPDAWEIQFGLDPNDPADAAMDADGDGVSNLEEFLAGTPPFGSIDVDGNSQYDALTDGLLLLRSMFGLTDEALISGTVGSDAIYTTSDDILVQIDLLGDLIDIDGNGSIDALTDGLVTLRYLFGLRGDALVEGVIGSGATRTTAAEIEAHLDSISP